ncbi:MAG: ABC transporter permease [Candidatus Eisenbacteria bacterium]|uniref:ABC transporter permease n=1 Tax=Eiseniibacteriota bacterium TaxID=2212470 RepID=A0A7Y2H243_UNCEI|nr:ABC transporter permease [Candidatus Eisenbacteria bacterium]
MSQIKELTRSRFLLFIREPEAMFWVFLFPVVLALVLSFAFQNRGVNEANVGYVEGQLSTEWVQALEADSLIHLIAFEDTVLAARKLRSGAVAVMVSGENPNLHLNYDPTRPESEIAQMRITNRLQAQEGRQDVVLTETTETTEHGSRYIDFLLPGLLGMNLMGTSIWGTGFPIVEMRQKKLLKRFLVTPMKKTSFLLAQILSRFGFLVAEVIVITAFGVFLLGVPFRGSIITFSILSFLGAISLAGIGLLVASRAKTIEGVSGIMNFVMMPMWLFSGVFFSYENFPEAFHPVFRLLPLTALNDGLRRLMLEGDGIQTMGLEISVLTVWAILSFVAALKIFRWK